MSNLIGQVSNLKEKTSYQEYTVQHGIERIQILVPVARTSIFEQQFAALTDKQKKTIISLVEQIGGKVRA